MLRNLGVFERAVLITSQHAPFNIVSVLRMENAPMPASVENALAILQARQPFLCARIRNRVFETLTNTLLPFRVIERSHVEQWRGVVEAEMAYHHDHEIGPLFRATYIYGNGHGDLVLNFHHTIMDAASGINFLDELLSLCSGEMPDRPPLQFAPAIETIFPPAHQGLRRAAKLAGYALAQMAEMLKFMWQTRAKRTPPVRLSGNGHLASLILPEDLVDSLSRQGRKRGVTLNSILNAAQMMATNRHLYAGAALPMQTFAFADLRPYTVPPTGVEQLANYISMMRFTVNVAGEMDFWALAKSLHGKIYRALKSGDKFNAALMAENLMKMFVRMKSMRMGSTALNYAGNVPLKTQYGDIKVVGLHAFISAYDLGPEMASQARLFNDELWWDFMYLDTDMESTLAESILAEIKSILERASQIQV